MKNWSVKLGQLQGVDVYAHFSLLLIFIYYLWDASNSGPITIIKFTETTIIFIVLSLSIFLHELAHVIAAKWRGVSTPSITLWFFGGFVIPEKEPETPLDDIFVSSAGVIVNVLIALCAINALAATFAFSLSQRENPFSNLALANNPLEYTLSLIIGYNIFLFAFNLIPVLPLDGGRILRAALSMKATLRIVSIIIRLSGTVLGLGLGILAWRIGELVLGIVAAVALLITWIAPTITYANSMKPTERATREQEIHYDSDSAASTTLNSGQESSSKRSIGVIFFGVMNIIISLILLIPLSFFLSIVMFLLKQENIQAFEEILRELPPPVVIVFIVSFLPIPLLIAGVSLLLRKPISFHLHIFANCILSASIVGLIYSIPAILSARKPWFIEDLRKPQPTIIDNTSSNRQNPKLSFTKQQVYNWFVRTLFLFSLIIIAVYLFNLRHNGIAYLSPKVAIFNEEEMNEWKATISFTNQGLANVAEGLKLAITSTPDAYVIITECRKYYESPNVAQPNELQYNKEENSCTASYNTMILSSQSAQYDIHFKTDGITSLWLLNKMTSDRPNSVEDAFYQLFQISLENTNVQIDNEYAFKEKIILAINK